MFIEVTRTLVMKGRYGIGSHSSGERKTICKSSPKIWPLAKCLNNAYVFNATLPY
jgi:hypothetical protein